MSKVKITFVILGRISIFLNSGFFTKLCGKLIRKPPDNRPERVTEEGRTKGGRETIHCSCQILQKVTSVVK